MVFDPLAWLSDELDALDDRQLRRRLRTRHGSNQAEIELDGRRLVHFGSNDYLGLAGDPRLIDAAAEGARSEGAGSGASALITGHSAWHAQLERRLADFEGAEAALLFNSGFSANVGVIPALVGPGDIIFSDELNHASIIDGCRLSRAEVQIYPHGDMAGLEQRLRQTRPVSRRRLIITETLFSMDGDVAPLEILADLATRYETMWMVDEAHATGVFGPQGRGLSEAFGTDVAQRIDIRLGTLSKALGSSGGFVVGRQVLIDALVNRARSYIFSTALPASAAAAASVALDIIQHEPERRSQLLARAQRLREALEAEGWDIGRSTSQIIPILIGSETEALRFGASLLEQGLFVPVIRPPSVPAGSSRLRISLSWFHDDAQLDRLIAALRKAKRR